MKLKVLKPNRMDLLHSDEEERLGQTGCENCYHDKCSENTTATHTVLLIYLIEHFCGSIFHSALT